MPNPAEFGQPDAALIHGIAAYRRHPYRRTLIDPDPVWQEGETCLRDYGGGGAAPALLLIPSLVNRATILDLAQDSSLARFLADAGLRVLLLDWGWPDAAARRFDLATLVTGRLQRAIDAAVALTGGAVTLVGYCMGGLLALAAAQLRPAPVAGLALLATPWDFHLGAAPEPTQLARLIAALEPVITLADTLPVDALQTLFNLAEPHAVGDKYRAFGGIDPMSARAQSFVAIEDWLNDGIPLAGPIARQTLQDWYERNLPARGLWQIGETTIDPARISLPSLAAIPARDRIVPPNSALALANALPGCTILRPQAGHVGMIVGANARAGLWTPLANWARQIPANARFKKRGQKSKLQRGGENRREKPE